MEGTPPVFSASPDSKALRRPPGRPSHQMQAHSTLQRDYAYNTGGGRRDYLNLRPIRILLPLSGLAALTLTAHLVPVNATAVGFAYLLLVLVIASTWGFLEASILSVAATLTLNFFFFAPVGTFNIAGTENCVALFTFLTTSLIASRLSTRAKQRALDAIERQQDIERLYAFSRAILLMEGAESFRRQLITKLADIFELDLAMLYDRRTEEFFRAGPLELEGLEERLREATPNDAASSINGHCLVAAIRLGSAPIAALAVQSPRITDSILQGIANLVAIGLERARAQELAHEIEAARRSEQLRTTLIDAFAHEFKTPLTSIRAMTTLLLDSPDQPENNRMELLKVADEEAEHLSSLIDDTVAMARLDAGCIQANREASDLTELVHELAEALNTELQGRDLRIDCGQDSCRFFFDRRLVRLALKQLVENALKYSLPGTPVTIRILENIGSVAVEVTDQGGGIAVHEQHKIFDRFYRSPSVKDQIPGSGLGLSIAQSIAHAHNGDLTVSSRPGQTTFTLSMPTERMNGGIA